MATSDQPIAYRKFTGQRGSVVSVEQLWAGADHLLLVSSSFAMERYRRFYFQDIEALIIRPTDSSRRWIIADSIGLVLCGGGAALLFVSSQDDAPGLAVFFSFVAAFFLFGLLYQLIRGPSCHTFLQMRTGLERVAPASRIRSSLKMRAHLATLIAAAAEARAVSSLK